MAFSWSGKKDVVGSLQSAEPCAGDEALEFEQLTGHLEKLRELFQQANERIAAYLIRRESQADRQPGDSGEAAGLRERLDTLAQMIQRLTVAPSSAPAGADSKSAAAHEVSTSHLIAELKEAVGASVEQSFRGSVQAAFNELRDSLEEVSIAMPRQWAGLESQIRQIREQSDESLRRLAELTAVPQPEDEPQTVMSGDWEQAILGAALAADPALASQRQQLLSGVLEGNAGACALAGQLLVFHSSPTERLPQLLKDVGEAYYRWQPKTRPGNTPMEEALVRWLQQNCETAGLANVIELVHPGERFDSTRHVAANTRGVEITEVLGWIVLRDNGKVYTKASVVVR